MRLRRTALALSAVASILILNCCSSNGPTFTPTPIITSISPDGVFAGGAPFLLTASGIGFLATSQIFWNGSCVESAPPAPACAPVSFNASTTQLSVTIPSAYIANTGFPQITVVNPFPGGPSLQAATFTISAANNPIPTITSLAPSNTPVGVLPPNGTITVNGTNFIQSSTVSFNGNPRGTQFVSATQLTATVLAGDVASAGGINVQVSNPSPGGGVSASSTFTVGPVPAAVIRKGGVLNLPSAELISVSALGGVANGRSSVPAISADGRFIAFYSEATNLVASGASGSIFMRDTCLGAVNCAPQTLVVDLDADGNSPSARAAEQVAIGADGRFVAFSSSAANLVAGLDVAAENKDARIYVRDLCEGSNVPAGCTPHTELVSIGTDANPVGGAFPAVSGDGRFIAFVSAPSNSPSGPASQLARVYVRDTCAGPTANSSCAPSTIAIDSNGAGPESAEPLAISASGRYVAFTVAAPANDSADQQPSSVILLADTCEGLDAPPSCTPKTIGVSVAPDGASLQGRNALPSVSDDGRFIAFESQALSASPNVLGSAPQTFLRDTCLGQTAPNGCTPSTILIADKAAAPSISASGQYISYIAVQGVISADAAAMSGALYVYDTCFGGTALCTPGQEPAVGVNADASSGAPLAHDGAFAAFSSTSAVGFLPSSGLGDVFLIVLPH